MNAINQNLISERRKSIFVNNTISEIDFEKNLLPFNFNFLSDAIEIWEKHNLVIRATLPYILDGIFV
jgi:hypothetical protein